MSFVLKTVFDVVCLFVCLFCFVFFNLAVHIGVMGLLFNLPFLISSASGRSFISAIRLRVPRLKGMKQKKPHLRLVINE